MTKKNRLRVSFPILLKRPRPFAQWPSGGKVLVLVLAVIIIGMVVLALKLLPAQLFPDKDSDRWAAEAALAAYGGVILAFIATVVAVIAYINSTEKPQLRIARIVAPGLDPGEPMSLSRGLTNPSWLGWPGWTLILGLENTGPVAARFIAVRITFEGAGLGWAGLAGGGNQQRVADLAPWLSSDPPVARTTLTWEGGADAVVHPQWSYEIPQLGPGDLRIADSPEPTLMRIEIVGDDIALFTERYPLHFLPPAL